MNERTFYGPFHFDEINPDTGRIEKAGEIYNLKTAGIYIWGFMYHYNQYGLIAPVNFRNSVIAFKPDAMKFIPYYVGESAKDIYKERMVHHHDVRNKADSSTCDASKYTRFSHGFMSEFFMDGPFPIRIGKPTPKKAFIKLIETYPNAVTYHNNSLVLGTIYPKMQIITYKGNRPITHQKVDEFLIPDTLEDIVVNMNNFWFCFAQINENRNTLEIYETIVFYSLNGKTISMTQRFKEDNQSITIYDKTTTSVTTN